MHGQDGGVAGRTGGGRRVEPNQLSAEHQRWYVGVEGEVGMV